MPFPAHGLIAAFAVSPFGSQFLREAGLAQHSGKPSSKSELAHVVAFVVRAPGYHAVSAETFFALRLTKHLSGFVGISLRYVKWPDSNLNLGCFVIVDAPLQAKA